MMTIQKTFVESTIFFFLCIALFLSCRTGSGKKTAQIEGDIQFYRQEIFVPLWNKDELKTAVPAGVKNPSLYITLSLPRVNGKATEKDKKLEAFFEDLFYQGMDPKDYAKEQIRVKTLEYRDIKEQIRDQDDRISSDTLNWYYEEKFEVEMSSPGFLVLSRNWADYTGGAHGNYGKKYFVLNRETAELISLTDIVKDEFREALEKKLNRELRKNWELEGGDSLEEYGFFTNQVELTENFFLTSKGLGFHWDPYEIAPYAMGFVEIVIPYGRIGDILNPLGHSLARELGAETSEVVSGVSFL
ncbi:MAG: DUF3298 and DUF4163 domain-containing protein [Treponema sp.]|jgi:hypothetical protein|nr:DUF3298 and DUF4163 domain-containing protein [Treponema sp.]